MNKIILPFLISFLVVNCDTSERNFEKIIESYDDGQVKLKKVFSSEEDSINCTFFEYYPNGQISRTGPMLDSIVKGEWQYYFQNGQIKQVGTYLIDDSLNSGCWTYTYWQPLMNEYGDVLPERDLFCSYDYMERESHNLHVCKEGYWETFFENGNLASKCTYENGWIIGVYEEYYENGQVKLIANFDKKDRIGRWEYFYDNGRKKKEVSFVDNEGTILNFWLSDGEQTLEKGNGALYEVIDDGDSIVQEFMDYQLHGRYFVFRRRMDNNDRYGIDSEYHYKNGLENGTRKHYGVYADTDEERLSFTMEFKEGKRDGYWVRYFRFDTVAISFFIDDLEHGTSAVYHENSGSLESKETWRMGVRHGIRKYYTYSGRPKKYQYIWEDDIVGHETIEKGEIVSTYIPSGDTSLFYKAKKLFK